MLTIEVVVCFSVGTAMARCVIRCSGEGVRLQHCTVHGWKDGWMDKNTLQTHKKKKKKTYKQEENTHP